MQIVRPGGRALIKKEPRPHGVVLGIRTGVQRSGLLVRNNLGVLSAWAPWGEMMGGFIYFIEIPNIDFWLLTKQRVGAEVPCTASKTASPLLYEARDLALESFPFLFYTPGTPEGVDSLRNTAAGQYSMSQDWPPALLLPMKPCKQGACLPLKGQPQDITLD